MSASLLHRCICRKKFLWQVTLASCVSLPKWNAPKFSSVQYGKASSSHFFLFPSRTIAGCFPLEVTVGSIPRASFFFFFSLIYWCLHFHTWNCSQNGFSCFVPLFLSSVVHISCLWRWANMHMRWEAIDIGSSYAYGTIAQHPSSGAAVGLMTGVSISDWCVCGLSMDFWSLVPSHCLDFSLVLVPNICDALQSHCCEMLGNPKRLKAKSRERGAPLLWHLLTAFSFTYLIHRALSLGMLSSQHYISQKERYCIYSDCPLMWPPTLLDWSGHAGWWCFIVHWTDSFVMYAVQCWSLRGVVCCPAETHWTDCCNN